MVADGLHIAMSLQLPLDVFENMLRKLGLSRRAVPWLASVHKLDLAYLFCRLFNSVATKHF